MQLVRNTFKPLLESFYPSISLDLYEKALNFAKQITPIAYSHLRIMMHSRKTLLFHGSEPFIKREGNENFSVPMGCFDEAEVCELVGIYILSQLNTVFENENVGLYRDNGLGPGPEIERKRKAIVRAFKEFGLSITSKVNLKVVNFLDIQLDLVNGTYRPYRKPNDSPMYIDINSNHPPSIKKQIPKSISKRIPRLSSNEEILTTV